LADLAQLDDAAFRQLFAGSAIKRTGRDRFVRNVLIALGNSGDAAAIPVIEWRLADASPLVRGAAIWALAQLADAVSFDRWRDGRRRAEHADAAGAEWQRAAAAAGE